MLTGDAIKEAHWDAFYRFYLNTGRNKWGQPYLTREFFSMIGETLARISELWQQSLALSYGTELRAEQAGGQRNWRSGASPFTAT